MNKDQLRFHLERVKAVGIIEDYQIQSNMPGLRWTVWGAGYDRSFTTAELRIWIDGLIRGGLT